MMVTLESEHRIRLAGVEDAPDAARLLHDFNTEFDDPTPGVADLTVRMRRLLAEGQATVLLGGERPDAIAVLRFRPSLWADSTDAYLEELYVAPQHRGHGLGRAVLDAALAVARDRGAGRIELGTDEDDTVARALYESSGFTNLDDGEQMFYYERDL